VSGRILCFSSTLVHTILVTEPKKGLSTLKEGLMKLEMWFKWYGSCLASMRLSSNPSTAEGAGSEVLRIQTKISDSKTPFHTDLLNLEVAPKVLFG
jgi:hypothetical protein